MCGISGVVHSDSLRPVDLNLLARMNAVQCHRGPDDEAKWTSGHVGLGQRRLAIIDLSPGGRQPMSNEDGSVWITYNGEIYNHRELRAELERRGHYYHGASDTETILHLYEEYGRDCVQHLRGMFAFALWDSIHRRLLLARDRFGKKPLVYAETPGGLVFASEIKAVLQDPDVSREVDPVALHHYLTYGYVPAPWTAFRGIRKLPPASTLVWEGGRISIERYWKLSFTPKLAISTEEAVEELLARLREATRIRLMSEVPLGAFLSGGIDSSAVVALMAEELSEPVKTFSIGFTDETFNELPYARLVAERYQTEHHEFTVTPDAFAMLPELVWAFGEPFADSSALPYYYLSKLARQHVTVALNGDGCDELFAGYERYRATRFAASYARLPVWLRENLAKEVAGRLPEGTGYRDPFRRLKRFLEATEAAPERRYARWITLFDNLEKELLYTSEYRRQVAGVDSLGLLETAYIKADSPDFVERIQFADIETYLPGDLLVKADIAGMMNSLEPRTPFLDHELAEWTARLPPRMKLRGRVSKAILRQTFEQRLPEAVLHRRKQGFGAPLGAWFRGGLKPASEAVLLSTRTEQRGLLYLPALKKLFDDHVSGRANNGYRLWQLLCLELWFRTYVDRPRAELIGPASGLFG